MKIRNFILTALALGATFSTAFADKNKNVLDIKHSITDDAIVFPESFEQDTKKMLEGWYMLNYTASDDHYRTRNDVSVTEQEYIKRLSQLPTVIDMPYNQIVRQYIERYTNKGRAQVASILGLSLYYNPIFEQALEEAGLPLELKYLPVIESALNPNAVSHSGATGLWQLMLVTAKGLGMEVNSIIDERRDPYASSKKAVGYLKDLYNTYGDWSLAIAAYNCGPGNVNKALRRAGGDPKDNDFWKIYNYLPAETRGYVPQFIAANYVMTYYPAHNISPVLPTKPLVTDTIHISSRIHFNQIASILNIPVEEIRILNPQYRSDIIPGSADHQYCLTLPSQQIQAYLVSEDQIKAYQAERYARHTTATPGENASSDVASLAEEELVAENSENIDDSGNATDFDDIPAVGEEPVTTPRKVTQTPPSTRRLSPGERVTHKVQEGESLATIANLYGVTPENIKVSNNMRRNSVRIGQQLVVEAPGGSAKENATASQSAAPSRTSAANTQPTTSKKSNNNVAQANTVSNSKKKTGTEQASSSKKKSKTKQTPATTDHIIRAGENLSTIARKNGVTVDELKKANNLTSDNIRAGKTLKIPAKKISTGTSKKKSSGAASSSSKSGKKGGKKKRR